MQAHLSEVAKTCKDKDKDETVRTLINAFLTHREMGECEAHYRIFPELHLS